MSQEARAWFERQPREVRLALATRSALCLLPRIEVARHNPDFAPRVAQSVLSRLLCCVGNCEVSVPA